MPPFDKLPKASQTARLWALAQPALGDAEDSERTWSAEYLAEWIAKPQDGSLGDIPIIVLARNKGGYGDGRELSAEQLERDRREEHATLARLSSRGAVRFVETGHEIEVDAPELVVGAVREVLVQRAKNAGR